MLPHERLEIYWLTEEYVGAITDAELRIANYYADRLSGTAWRIMKRWGG